MAGVGLSEAGETLRDYFGPRLDANEASGPDRMIDALVEKLHVSKEEAKKLVADLIEAHSIRYVPEKPNLPGIAGSGQEAGGRFAAEVASPLLPEQPGKQAGYWRLQ